jgi:two-component system chemotaxis response regulator CheB
MTNAVVVDDSQFMRTQIAGMLEDGGLTVVGRARNGREAVEMTLEHEPDVVTMDIKMPGIGGVEAVKRIMAEQPTPVLALSGYTESGSNLMFDVLEAGAIDFFPKPGGEVSPTLINYQDLLTDNAFAIANADLDGDGDAVGDTPTTSPSTLDASGADVEPAVPELGETAVPDRPTLVIGASTGGPKAVERLMRVLPADLDFRVLIVVHMPEDFTTRYAERLDRSSPYDVTEANPGTVVGEGEAVVARGNRHLEVVEETAEGLRLGLTEDPPRHSVRPAIDVTMETAATVVQGPLFGVVLTGMGQDGSIGLEAIKETGGRTIVQDPDSCAVEGMPERALETGAVDDVLRVEDIPGRLASLLSSAEA